MPSLLSERACSCLVINLGSLHLYRDLFSVADRVVVSDDLGRGEHTLGWCDNEALSVIGVICNR